MGKTCTLRLAAALLCAIPLACGSSQATIPIPTAATTVGNAVETDARAADETGGSLGSFFSDPATETAPAPVLASSETTEGASPAEPDREPEPAADPEPTTQAERSDQAESTEQPDQQSNDTPNGGLPPNAGIAATPDSVLLAATHAVTITGTDLPPEVELIVAACQLGGDPIGTDMAAATLVERATAITPSEDCDLAGSQRVTVGVDGGFEVELDVDVGPATAIFAGGVDADYAVFTPIYLQS